MNKVVIALFLLAGLIVLSIWYTHEKAVTHYTNVIVKNSSPEDSVQVFITIQAPNSVVGMFGMTADDTLNSCSQGTFLAYKDSSYNSNCTGVLNGLVISFGGVSGPCAQTIAAGFPTGINIFECSINTAFESFDMSCEDGMNAMLKISVSDTVNWMYGDGPQIATFDTTRNVFPIRNNVNLPGIFPYLCTNCIDETAPIPQNCLNLQDSCSTYATCQTSRTYANGGIILLEYLGGIPQICK
jgi:hypothetical protein